MNFRIDTCKTCNTVTNLNTKLCESCAMPELDYYQIATLVSLLCVIMQHHLPLLHLTLVRL